MNIKPYLVSTPWWLKRAYPGLEWRKDVDDQAVYLTFDDGPHPEITPWVLEQLDRFGFRASFFLIGDNIRKYPDTYRQLEQSPHSLGSHTMKHLNGWKNSDEDYLRSFREGAALVNSDLFRPPYGRIRRRQARVISETHRIIMWDVLSADFDVSLSADECIRNVVNNVRPGSIVVFHDSEKAWPRMEKALPGVLEYFHQQGLYSKSL